ncbi:hypothetical protein JCM10908_006598 [Rhodotorula pacifica]|uniref:uncharacterized protein n=1 Tax=Rhodotorula pacifica TaxID=1495444 RepID=UPI00316BD6FD
MLARPSTCLECLYALQRRTFATTTRASQATPRRTTSSKPAPTPEELLQRHPAFAQAVEQRSPPPSRPVQSKKSAKWTTVRSPSAAKPRTATSSNQPAYREPPLVERARQKTVAQRSVWESYLVLPWNVRLSLWLGIAAFATVGLYAGDHFYPVEEGELERAVGGVEEEKERLGTAASADGRTSRGE